MAHPPCPAAGIVHRVRGSVEQIMAWKLNHPEKRQGHHGQEEQIECGKDPQRAPRVETLQTDTSGILLFAEQKRCDQESGDHKENLNSESAMIDDPVWDSRRKAFRPVAMREHYQKNREGPQSVQRWNIADSVRTVLRCLCDRRTDGGTIGNRTHRSTSPPQSRPSSKPATSANARAQTDSTT